MTQGDAAMKWLPAILAVLTVGIALLTGRSALGQELSPLNRPTLSPWFGLYQRNSGPLDNYHTFVRPEIQLRNTLRNQQANIQQNTAAINALGQDAAQTQEYGRVRPTGTGSTFMTQSSYFQTNRSATTAARTPTAQHRANWSPSPASHGGRAGAR
jgi:hypothetical protein